MITDIFSSISEKSQEYIKVIYDLITRVNIRLHKKLIMLILIVIWLIFSTILTKIFSSVLLNTYLNPKSYLAVNSLQDVIELPRLSIGGSHLIFYINESLPEVYQQLIGRAKDYETKCFEKFLKGEKNFNKLFQSEQVLSQVSRGETVLFIDSFSAGIIIRQNPWLRLTIVEGVGYSPHYVSLFVHKEHKFYKKIVEM